MNQEQATRPVMTAEDARRFDRFSEANAAEVEASLECGCKAYQDVFTYNRWKAQGFQVQKGQRALKLAGYFTKTSTDKESGEERVFRIPRTNAVFCRHQVAEVSR